MPIKVLFVIASQNFRDPEYFEPKRVLESNGITVITTSNSRASKGAEGNTVNVDLLFKDVVSADYDAVAFIGGPGSPEYFDDPKAHQIAKDMVLSGKVISAICAAVSTLANAGILKGKKATSFDGVSDTIKAGGAVYTGKGVEVDGNIITADGPRSAKAFGQALAKALKA